MPADEQQKPSTPGAAPPGTTTPPHVESTVEKLEDKIKELAHGTSGAVTGAIQSAKEGADAVHNAIGHAAKESIASVTSARTLTHYVRRHPWLAVGCAAALGFACSNLVTRR